MKKIILLFALISFSTQAQLRGLIKKTMDKSTTVSKIGGFDIGAGLKEALNKGVTEQVSKLTAVDGFYGNEAVKILMPAEFQSAENTLRKIGLGNLTDDAIKSLNRAAEDAVKVATPIFVSAIKNMSITDAKNILMGKENAATTFLQTNTNAALYAKFNPVVQQSIGKVGADIAWNKIITKYNSVPFITKINPDITDYVTKKALEGVFKMITVQEVKIRTDLKARTSPLLQKIFAMQDGK